MPTLRFRNAILVLVSFLLLSEVCFVLDVTTKMSNVFREIQMTKFCNI